MSASLPGENLPGFSGGPNANPYAGRAVTFDPLSGPKASPFDARTITGWTNGMPTYANNAADMSTGGLSTGIGFGAISVNSPVVSGRFAGGNFTDDYIPGQTKPDGTPAADSSMMYIGGGRCNANGVLNPYAVGMVGVCTAGGGNALLIRDGGSTPFTGSLMKSVTATGTTATGVAVEAGFLNSGSSIPTGTTTFGFGAPLTDIA